MAYNANSPTSGITTKGTNTTGTAFTPDIQGAVKKAITNVNDAYGKKWEVLGNQGQYFAPTNAAQKNYFTNAEALKAPDEYDSSGNLFTGVGSSTFNQAQADQYMSPYQAAVTQTTMDEMQRQQDRELAQLGLRSVKGAGLGSSGYSLAQALSNQNYGQTAAAMYAKLQQAAYENAQKQYNAEQASRLQAAQGLGSLGANISSSDIDRLKAQGLAATEEYNLAQKPLDLRLQEDKAAREAPMTMASNQVSALQGIPRETTETQTKDETQNTYGVDPSTLQMITSGINAVLQTATKGEDIVKGLSALFGGAEKAKKWFGDLFGDDD